MFARISWQLLHTLLYFLHAVGDLVEPCFLGLVALVMVGILLRTFDTAGIRRAWRSECGGK